MAIYRLVESCAEKLSVRCALEGPVDGFAGMPGLHLLPLARRGVGVTVVSDDPRVTEQVRRVYEAAGLARRLEVIAADELAAERRFDLVFSFNALPAVQRWRTYLASLIGCAASYALIVVTNPHSYGVTLRRLMRRRRAAQSAPLFDHEATEPRTLQAALEQYGRIRAQVFVDCPWWPDLFVPTGQTLLGWLLGDGRWAAAAARWIEAPSFVHDADGFPFVGSSPPPALRRALRRHPVFEDAHPRLRRLFGHHQAYLIEVGRQDRSAVSSRATAVTRDRPTES